MTTILIAIAALLIGAVVGAAGVLGWFLWRYFTSGQSGPGG